MTISDCANKESLSLKDMVTLCQDLFMKMKGSDIIGNIQRTNDTKCLLTCW